ncbi:MAG: hypothetical protein MUP53_03950, partial [Bacteroidales bacterium]|nr:hypothetical protein [Bacteroidales bacterium]
MKKLLIYISVTSLIVIILISSTTCKKTENPIKFPKGTFPDSIINISGINSVYDDYNMDIYVISAANPLVFSS